MRITLKARRLILAATCLVLGAVDHDAGSIVPARADDSAEQSPAAAEAKDDPTFDAQSLEFFESKVRPLFVAHCYECHGPEVDEPKGGLRMTGRAALLAGGDTGPAIVPGKPKKSLLIDAVNYGDLYEMPPDSKLAPEQIAILTKWVETGAAWPADETTTARATDGTFDLEARRASHWCWQPVKPQDPPAVRDEAWPSQPLDRFILARLEAEGLSPSPPASPAALVRRVFFDLIGLPPPPEVVERFVSDPSPEAYERIVDSLLDSPQFGERWGRHWLDLVRYAETYGHEFDYAIPDAWRYRDYVIRAFNADLPYDQFVTEHIAGDLLEAPRRNPDDGTNESIIGTGFWWLGEATHAPVDVRADQAFRADNQLDVMGKTFLGLTLGCARCHDHKFDAISTRDYYSLAGFLRSSRRQEALLDPQGKIADAAQSMQQQVNAASAALRESVGDASEGAADSIRHYLLAAREVAQAGDAAKSADIAGARGLNAELLSRWVPALEAVDARDVSHPMSAWRRLTAVQKVLEPQDIVDARNKLQSQSEAVDRARAEAPLLADFDDGTYDGWFVTGAAFGEAPTSAGQWDSRERGVRAASPGMAHSGMLARKLQGALRSPTFTIHHKNVLYRIAAERAQVRLVVDGYFMDSYSALLFSGLKFDVDTGGKLEWHVQSGDLSRYLGHRAYIEVVDNGDGWAAIDEIRFSDGGPPPDAPSRPALEALADAVGAMASASGEAERPSPLDAIATAYGKAISSAITRWHEGRADADDTRLLNWMLENDLFDSPVADDALNTQLAESASKLDELAKSVPDPVHVLAMADGSGENEHVFIRGNYKTLGDEVPRQFFTALGGTPQEAIGTQSGRLALAREIADQANPLTARVMVNRVWYHLFGRGIVASVDNFGVLGTEPTHPELLDYLATQFVTESWSVKRLIRSIVLSSTYRMSSEPDGAGDAHDPQNLLLHRQNIRRLEGEAIRDAMLAASGRLDPRQFGPSVPVHLTPFMQGRGRPGTSGPLDGAGRRSIYLEVRRNFLFPMLLAFDAPIPFNTIGRRNVSNVPAQALTLLNDPMVIEQARVWAHRMLATEGTAEQRIDAMYLEAFARPPDDQERAAALAFLDTQGKQLGLSPEAARASEDVWADLCHVLFNVKEFIFIR